MMSMSNNVHGSKGKSNHPTQKKMCSYHWPLMEAWSFGKLRRQAPRVRHFSGQWTMDASGLLWTLVDDGLWTEVDFSGGWTWTEVDVNGQRSEGRETASSRVISHRATKALKGRHARPHSSRARPLDGGPLRVGGLDFWNR